MHARRLAVAIILLLAIVAGWTWVANGQPAGHVPSRTPEPSAATTAGLLGAGRQPSATVTIAAAGDIACDPQSTAKPPHNCDQAATAQLIIDLDPAAVLTLGDTQYERGAPDAFSVFDASWGQFLPKIRPAPGNHEYLTKQAAGYFGYFGAAAGDPTRGYYSFDLGAWHILSLNSECRFAGGCSHGSPQETWLRADLAANAGVCTLAYWHEPRWSSGEHGDAIQMATIWADLVAARASIVLAGHNHDYERFEPLDANGSPSPTGVQEFVVGTGGKNHYPFKAPPLPGETVRDDTSYGVLELVLAPSSYSWQFLPAPTYHFTDSGSMPCR